MSANTWNRSGTTWSQGLWGEQDSNLIDLTGVSASFSLGEVVSFAEQGWGRDDWGTEPWGESFDPVITVSGFSLTASLGTTTESNQTGWGRLSWGIADWGEGRDETVSLTGIELTSSLGDITTENIIFLEMIGSNHSLTSSVGSPQVDGEIGVPLTGVSAEFATPTMSYVGTLVGWGRDAWGDNSWGESPNQVIPLVGQDTTASVGAPTLEFAYELSGQSSTSAVGSITPVDVIQGLVLDQITSTVGLLGIESYANIDTGSNTSYTSVATGSNSSYSNVATGSNTSYSDVA